MEAMERFHKDPLEWEALGHTEEGQYAQAEMIEYVVSKGQMMAYEQHEQQEEYHRKFGKK